MQPLNLEAILLHFWIAGRSSRAEWWRVHITCAVLAVMVEHAMVTQLAPRADGNMPAISMLWPLASLALAWVSFASVVRRFHDRGKSGWWALLYFVPVIGWLWILIECGFLPGKLAAPAARVPAFTPAPSKPIAAPASRSAARLQATPRAGTIQRADPPHPLKTVGVAVAVLALIAMVAVLATSTIRISEIGPHDRLPGDFARDPDER